MWLGAAGIILRHALIDWGIVRNENFTTVLALMRLPTALVHTAAVLVGYNMLRRLLPAMTALFAAVLWATDPFMIGYSRLLHVDALAATFVGLSLLAACVYWHHERSLGMLVLSGICGGLAFLSKTPSLALLPGVTALVFLHTWRQPESLWKKITQSAPELLVWVALFVATIFICWPAMWVNPLQPYITIHNSVATEGGRPQHLGNYFMGHSDRAPGVLFYPVALALRLTPWTLVGLLLLPFAWRRVSKVNRHDLAALACFAVLFIVAMSIFPKKFNRYVLPVFPGVDVLAAVGLIWGAEQVGMLAQRVRSSAYVVAPRITNALLSIVVLVALANVAWWHPYSIAYFNQILGGHQAGKWAFFLGWGEGFEQVAAWLNKQPDIKGVVTLSRRNSVLHPYLREGAQSDEPGGGKLPPDAGYVVVYIRQVQGSTPSPPLDTFYKHAVPIHTVTIHGVDYAWIYKVPPPVAQQTPADFGNVIHLRGVKTDGKVQRGKQVSLKLFWDVKTVPSTNYTLFAHLIGPNNQRYAQIDLPYPTSQWQPGHFPLTELPLTIPADAPAGTYSLYIGMYDPATGQRLPLTGTKATTPALDGTNALVLAQWVLP
jgi:hypothetical protein